MQTSGVVVGAGVAVVGAGIVVVGAGVVVVGAGVVVVGAGVVVVGAGVAVVAAGVVVGGAGVVVIIGIVSLGEPSQQCRERNWTWTIHTATHDVGQYCAAGAMGPL